ncbi:hypothetical protein FNV43_RR20880 [Rhamnella rubrinervis]|uniref:Pectate lyase n=1 Tax=Rhamnella rubrinervis TaxID=2594499 RepID=A0A8K0E204_9ROSA|nr:hypothetical protein FNV43_RR20880 [Rhamnella rubrinervis]
MALQFGLVILISALLFAPGLAGKTKVVNGLKGNAIDRCWRWNPNWRRNRQQLAACSVGFAGKMNNNMGRDGQRCRWMDMNIVLQKPLLISSFTAIDGRGGSIHIAGNACLLIFKESNIIIHGLRIHHCKAQGPSSVMGPNGKVVPISQVDGDAIRLVTASKVWIDHNTLYECQDGLLDVTRGSTEITVSNNWFRNQDKVMLLGHDDGYMRDKNMKVTVLYNHFGPSCNQRMPRVRFGYAHVVNNLYQGWTQYAIGGSMSPSVKSEANLFIAPKSGNKEVTWRRDNVGNKKSWNFYSVRDVFENGASFIQTGTVGGAKPNYNGQQNFRVVDAKSLRSLTRSAGALQCTKRSRC